MMGPTHALCGVLGFGCATLAYAFRLDQLLIAGHLTIAASLLPDLDHHKATITRTLGGVSRIFRWVLIRPFFGKHREGTHSIFFAALVGWIAWLLIENLQYLGCKIALIVILGVTTSALIRLFKIKGWLDDVIAFPLWGFVIFFTDVDLSLVPWALAGGCLIHMFGDCLTDRGCPILWPISKQKIAFPIFSTGKNGEKGAQIVIALCVLGVLLSHGLRFAGIM
jgi:membrane-bound metal-dependent hydrolase YbcI (DUF457 family)